ncbi:hypothetical protein Afe04nite_20700 [Asanoa ferruginea]|uniref:hypothetical protein n=1 Tax=Asanoa ferruginea TaxID=53367 RepID=UPI000E23E8FB|nr:hypothetical protein [Asanoa ferruginea]GIF47531.1 hypothetical protein Afe04nite_20700 [Asanoa ferruginea]
MTSTGEQELLNRLKQAFARVDDLAARVQTRERMLIPSPGSDLAEDDRLSHPFRVSHAATSALVVAVDHLDSLHRMTVACERCEPNGMAFSVSAHWTLLRGALENSARAVWLLGPPDRAARVTRALRLQTANVAKSDEAEQLMSGPRNPRAQRIDRVKEIAARAGVLPG